MKFKALTRVLSIVMVVAMMCLVLSGCTVAGDSESSGSTVYTFIMMAVIVVVFYFFLIRPENKKKKKLQEMRSEISTGDDIVTIGGIVGKVVGINDEYITFETGEDRVRMQVTKWAISSRGKENETK